jgi:hypothetical protein
MAAVRVEIPKCQQLRPPETLRRRFHTTKTQSGPRGIYNLIQKNRWWPTL